MTREKCIEYYNKPVGTLFRQRVMKRFFDIMVSSAGLLLTWWIILLACIIATIDTRKNGFFTQTRIGRYKKPFKVIKIRTMRNFAPEETNVTTSSDSRITRLGRILRKTKVDELPQLINILKGDMSFVGPRPDVPGLADNLIGFDRLTLSLRPGITGPATLKYRNEEELLTKQADPEKYSREVIFPDKVKLNRQYIENYSFWKDIIYIWETIK